MIRFKQWLEISGPGGGPDWHASNPEDLPLNTAKKGAGAFPVYNRSEDPPRIGKSPTEKYLDPRFKRMKKK